MNGVSVRTDGKDGKEYQKNEARLGYREGADHPK